MTKNAEKLFVNLGCGHRFHADWKNYDLVSAHPEVIACDLSRGIPLPDNTCDVVYHSNLFEHLRRPDAVIFMKECYRVLKPGGILRVVLPDLERCSRVYLEKVEGAARGDEQAIKDYDWIILEMLDQVVRERGGGDMLEYFRQDPIPNESFIYERIGVEGRNLVGIFKAQRSQTRQASTPPSAMRKLKHNIKHMPKHIGELPETIGKKWKQFLHSMVLTPQERKHLELGRFRDCGEVHQWLYDRFSLARLMKQTGFKETVLQTPQKSLIPEWPKYHLDTLDDGTVIKPDSFIMEAVK